MARKMTDATVIQLSLVREAKAMRARPMVAPSIIHVDGVTPDILASAAEAMQRHDATRQGQCTIGGESA
jgi:hypothetical protein